MREKTEQQCMKATGKSPRKGTENSEKDIWYGSFVHDGIHTGCVWTVSGEWAFGRDGKQFSD